MSYPPPPPGDAPDGSAGDGPPSYPPPPPGGPGGYGYGGYQPPPPGAPAPGYGVPQANRKALWAMIIGIVSLPLACYACLGWIGIAAIVLGTQAKREIAASGGYQTGAGQAKAGVITGWVGTVAGTVVLIVNIVLVATGNDLQYNFDTTS